MRGSNFFSTKAKVLCFKLITFSSMFSPLSFLLFLLYYLLFMACSGTMAISIIFERDGRKGQLEAAILSDILYLYVLANFIFISVDNLAIYDN